MGKLVAKPPKKKEPKVAEPEVPVDPALAQDEFTSFWGRVGEQARGRLLPIGIGVAAAAIFALVSYSTTRMSEGKKERASRDLARAAKIYGAQLKSEETEAFLDKAKELQAQAGQDPGGDEDIPRFKTQSEKLEAALKEVDQVTTSAPQPTAQQAGLARAALLIDLGRYDDALKIYDDYVATAKDSSLRFLARQGRAVVLESKGNLDGALAELKILETEAPFYAPRAQVLQARLLAKKGDRAGAEKLLKGVLDRSPSTGLREEVNSRLASLESS